MSRQKNMKIAIGLLALTVVGCVTVKQRDPETIASFQKAIDAREADWDRVERALAIPTPTARDINGMRLLNQAELDRLRASKFREEAKYDGGAR